jgi:hypothetical protein
VNDVPMMELPDWLSEIYLARKGIKAASNGNGSHMKMGMVRQGSDLADLVETLRIVPEDAHQLNHTLFQAAKESAKQGFDDAMAFKLLVNAAVANGHPRKGAEKTVESGLSPLHRKRAAATENQKEDCR